MNNYGEYLTPEQVAARTSMSLAQAKALARAPAEVCPNCDEQVWKYGQCGLCFSCTTGEADASEDYEIMTLP